MIFFACCATPGAAEAGQSRLLVVDKAAQSLAVFADGRLQARFPASFGVDPRSDKRRAHDLATPEGVFHITYRKDPSRFRQALGLSYPTLASAEKGLAAGILTPGEYRMIYRAVSRSKPAPCGTGLGCGIAVHGGGVYRDAGGSRDRDWTEGCIALDDADMEWLFARSRVGDTVVVFNSGRGMYDMIRPFTQARLRDADGEPVCPDGVCTYEAEVMTSLGKMTLAIREGRQYGMSLQVVVGGADGDAGPALEITDSNADGHISFLDKVNGTLAGGLAPDDAYETARRALADAIAGGSIPGPP